jgi:hypothetical protein
MSVSKKMVLALLVVAAALFSSNARKLLNIASNAVINDALANGDHGGGGASCD